MTALNRRQLVVAAGALAIAPVLNSTHVSAGTAAGTPGAGTPAVAVPTRDEILVSAADLATQLAGPEPPVVIALTEAEAFAVGHISGAWQIDWPALELDDTSAGAIAAWAGTTRAQLGALEIMPNATVVIYDGGTLFAARLWWVLDYFGHQTKLILDGGLPAWRADGQPVVTAANDATPPVAAPADYPANADENRLATLDQVVAALGDPAVAIVDARTADEFAAGHIPGAVNVNYPLNAQPDDPKTYLSGDELTQLYAGAGVTPDKLVIPYCATGVRSAVTYTALRVAGFPNVALYTGSWNEWGSDPETPKEP